MRIFVPTDVARSASKMGLGDEAMRDSISRAERGLIDAQIGAFLIKQRVPRRGAGRSGGFRTIVAYRRGSLAVFLHLFAKNTTANLTKVETEIFQRLATTLAHMNDETIERIAEENGWKRLHDENGSTRLQE